MPSHGTVGGKHGGCIGTRSRVTKQQRIAELAKQAPHMGFTSLAHHIDLRWLHEAYLRTRPDGATGVDGQTAADYDGEPRGQPAVAVGAGQVRHVPGSAGAAGAYSERARAPETRPIGIPTFEDKVLQRAVVMVLEAVYEQDFRDCSYGFRPGRSAHQALDSLVAANDGAWAVAGSWKWTSASSSTRWIMLTCGNCFGSGYATGCCCD